MRDADAAPRRILIVLLGALGDVARGLTVASQLKDLEAGIHITWLIEPKCRELLRYCQDIDETIVFERGRGIGALFALRRELRQRRFDLTLDLQRHFKSGLFSRLSRASQRIGFHRRNAKELNWLFSTATIPESPLD